MKSRIYEIILTGCITIGTPMIINAAPDSMISNQRVNIYQEYVPEVRMPVKPVLKPSDIDTEIPTNPQLEYKVPQQSIRYSYGSVGIKPLAMQPLERNTAYQNYASLGFGNLSTIIADVGLTYHQPGTYDAYIHGFHFSQKKGGIHDRKSSLTEVAAGGKYFWNNYAINADAVITRRGQTAYGYDHDNFLLDKKDVKHNYFNINFDASMDNLVFTEKNLAFQPHVNLNFLNGYQDASEMIFRFNAPVSYRIDENMSVSLALESEIDIYSHSWFNINDSRKTNSYFMIVPKFTYILDKFYAHIAIKPTFSTGNKSKILPDIQVRYALDNPSKISLSAGIKGDVEMYSFAKLSEKNPFVFNPVNSNAIHHQFFGGVEYSMLSNLKLELTAIYHTFNRYATYQNNFDADLTGRYFKMNYIDNTNIFELNAGAHILIANKFDLGTKLSFYNFKNSIGIAYNEPNVHLKSYMKVRPIPELLLGAQLDFLSGIKHLDQYGMRKNMPNIFNLSVSGQYDIKERYGVFLNIDNIFNTKYQRWNQYNVYGFNIFAGFKYKF